MKKFLQESYKFSADFNEQIYLRYCLWKNGKTILKYSLSNKKTKLNNNIGFMHEMEQLPGLLKQEKESFHILLTIDIEIYKLYSKMNFSQVEQYLNDFIINSIFLINHYSTKYRGLISLKRKVKEESQNEKSENVISHESKNIHHLKITKSFSDSEEIAIPGNLSSEENYNHALRISEENMELKLNNIKISEMEKELANMKASICYVISNLNEVDCTHVNDKKIIIIGFCALKFQKQKVSRLINLL